MNKLDNRQTVFLVMADLFQKARHYLDNEFKSFDLSRNEWLVLALLRTHPGGINQSIVKTHLGVETSYFTKILNKLEDRGLILREIDKLDRRNRIIRENPKSKHERNKIYQKIAKLNSFALADITDKQIKQLHQALALIETKLNEL